MGFNLHEGGPKQTKKLRLCRFERSVAAAKSFLTIRPLSMRLRQPTVIGITLGSRYYFRHLIVVGGAERGQAATSQTPC